MNINPFKKKTDEAEELIPESIPITPEIVENLPDTVKEKWKNEIADIVGPRLRAEFSETRTITEEAIPPVITIGTDLDKQDELTGEIRTKEDKWGFWLEYHGTKGKIFANEVPQMQFGHMGAILPGLRNHVYKYTYDIDKKTGNVKRDAQGNPIVLKKTRIHLAVELSNLKARLNLAEEGYARGQQERVIIGGVGQVSPMSEGTMDKAMELMFGRKK